MRRRRFQQFSAALIAVEMGILCQPSLAQNVGWSPLQIRNRTGHRMVYDSDRHVVVMFGGLVNNSSGGGTHCDELWEWNGEQWVQRNVHGPSPQSGHVMVYDSRRHVTVVFGSERPYWDQDVWEWDGNDWMHRHFEGQAPGPTAAGAFDAARGVVTVFDGATWTWDGFAWTRLNVSSPGFRSGKMAYDPERQCCVLIGSIQSGSIGQTWEWNGMQWNLKSSASEGGALYGRAMAYDSDRHVMILHGQFPYGTGVIWEWTGNSWIAASSGLSPSRGLAEIAYDTSRHEMVMFGGNQYEFPGHKGEECDTWIGRSNEWLAGPLLHPPARTDPGVAFDQRRNKLVLFGGMQSGESGIYGLGDMWEWDGTWHRIAVQCPAGRYENQMVFDSARGNVLMFGGRASLQSSFADTWEWDGTTWTQREVQGPPIGFYRMVYDTSRSLVVAHGGSPVRTWEWNGDTWQQRSAQTPLTERAFGLAYDQARARTVLYGGCRNGSVYVDETWTWDGQTWTRMNAVGPPSQYYPGMAYDAARQVVVLQPSGFDAATWEWNGQAWRRTGSYGPNISSSGTMAYDSSHQRSIFLGTTDTDIWGYGNSLGQLPAVRAVLLGGDCFESAAIGHAVVYNADPSTTYQWRFKETPVGDSLGLSDIEFIAGLDRLGSYDCVVTNSVGSSISNSVETVICSNGEICNFPGGPRTLLEFLELFAAGEENANINRDNSVDLFDYLDFIEMYSHGCS